MSDDGIDNSLLSEAVQVVTDAMGFEPDWVFDGKLRRLMFRDKQGRTRIFQEILSDPKPWPEPDPED